MIRVIQIVVIGILIYLVVKLVRLIMNYSSRSRSDIRGREKEKDEIRKHFENVEEADFREIKPDEEDNMTNKNNE